MFKKIKQRVLDASDGIRESTRWHRDNIVPKKGELAPDFKLRDVEGENPVRLSQYRGKKPVALIFGSFT